MKISIGRLNITFGAEDKASKMDIAKDLGLKALMSPAYLTKAGSKATGSIVGSLFIKPFMSGVK